MIGESIRREMVDRPGMSPEADRHQEPGTITLPGASMGYDLGLLSVQGFR